MEMEDLLKKCGVYPDCPFCGKDLPTSEHLAECSVRDAQKKLEVKGEDQEMASKINKLLTFIVPLKKFAEVFEAALDHDKDRMWLCEDCCEWGTMPIYRPILSLPNECPGCGSVHLQSARPYFARLMRE